jgi:hypothetical protein
LKLPLSVTAIAVMAAQPVLADYWVAVAVNKTVGQHGNSYFLGTKREAVNSALTNCKKFSKGAEGCEVVLVTRRCSGMAHAGRSIYVREGNSANKAGASALKACNANHGNACRIHETFCPNQ